MDPHGGPPEKPTGGSEPSAGYAEGPKPSVGKGGIKSSGPVLKPSTGYAPPVGPKKPTDGPKKGDSYPEAPEPHEMARANRVQDQAPCTSHCHFSRDAD